MGEIEQELQKIIERQNQRIKAGLNALDYLNGFFEQFPSTNIIRAMISIWFVDFTHPDEESAQKFLQDLIARNAKERLETLRAAPNPPPPSDKGVN